MISFSTPRAAIMAVFAAFGSCVGIFAGSVPQLIDHYSLDNASYGIGVTAMTAATVAAMGASGWLARHVSHRALLLFLLPAVLVLIAALLSGSHIAMFFFTATLYGAFSGMFDVIMNAEGGLIELDLKKPVYTAFHGSVSLSVAFFAILSSVLSTEYGTWASILAASVCVAAAMIMVWRNLPARTLPVKMAPGSKTALRSAFSLPLVLMGLAAGLIIAGEISALLWSSKLLAESAPQLAAISGLGAAFFGLCNAIVRFPGDYLRARFGDLPLMSMTILFAITGFAGLALTNSFALNVFFFALTGMGLAILCPCLFAMAARETPHNRAAGLSVSMLVAGVPRIIAPGIFGAIAEAFSIRAAFGVSALGLLGAFAVIRLIGRK